MPKVSTQDARSEAGLEDGSHSDISANPKDKSRLGERDLSPGCGPEFVPENMQMQSKPYNSILERARGWTSLSSTACPELRLS